MSEALVKEAVKVLPYLTDQVEEKGYKRRENPAVDAKNHENPAAGAKKKKSKFFGDRAGAATTRQSPWRSHAARTSCRTSTP